MSYKPTVPIIFDRVYKQYQKGMRLSGPIQKLRRWLSDHGDTDTDKDFWALQDVSFSVKSGEVLGIIGPNGAGKTTILKLLAGVTGPTSGHVNINGRLSALIQLGAGFHPELTGRENIYLNGAILGLKRRIIDDIYNDIVDFAELEDFIDTPVKRYSSGMYARLGFSVAVHVNPDILLVDEVLSVGDQSFQNKCYERMGTLTRDARAIVFVSHNLLAVQKLCHRVIWLSAGQIQLKGKPGEVIGAYINSIRNTKLNEKNRKSNISSPNAGDHVRITKVRTLDDGDQDRTVFKPGEQMNVRIEYHANQLIRDPIFAIAVWRDDGFKCGETSNELYGVTLGPINDYGKVRYIFHHLPFAPGKYSINVAVRSNGLQKYDHYPHAANFDIEIENDPYLYQGPFYFDGCWE